MKLPPPLSGKKDWPWIMESQRLTPSMENVGSWPMISIVTPSFNQGCYIEETIRSVLLQNYPNLEYFIIDGGSIDETVGIIKKYEKWLAGWVSEPDAGQSHAINKGFQQASGQIFGYINSDDLYEQDAFFKIAQQFVQNPELDLLAGVCQIFNENAETRLSKPSWPDDLTHFLKPFSSTFAQPSSFWSSILYRRLGGFNESLHYAFDQEFFLKAGLSGISPQFTPEVLSLYRDHKDVKTRKTKKFYEETIPIIKQYGDQCGLSGRDITRKIHKIFNDIEFFNIFEVWRKKGRKAAMTQFIKYMLKSPDFLCDRKVLGQARRLLMFKESDVAELNK